MSRAKYHHGDLRAALIDAATALVEEAGPDGASMREAARRAGVSSAAPYRHFKDGDELMSAVAAAGHRRLLAHMAAATRGHTSPLQQYRAHGIAYVIFAVSNPHLFRVMNTARWASAGGSPEMAAARAELDADTLTLVQRAQAAGELVEDAPTVQMLAAQALVHGLARMFVDGQMAEYGIGGSDAERIAEAVSDVLGVGLIPRSG